MGILPMIPDIIGWKPLPLSSLVWNSFALARRGVFLPVFHRMTATQTAFEEHVVQ